MSVSGPRLGWMAAIAKVEPLLTTRALSGPFDYRLPGGMDVDTGSILVVPFGRQKLLGVVVGVADKSAVPQNKLVELSSLAEDDQSKQSLHILDCSGSSVQLRRMGSDTHTVCHLHDRTDPRFIHPRSDSFEDHDIRARRDGRGICGCNRDPDNPSTSRPSHAKTLAEY